MRKPCRDRILDVAEERFAKLGFKGATTRELAEGAGCNVALISYYFGGKEGLYEELLARYFARLRREFERLVADGRHTNASLADAWPEIPGTSARARSMRGLAELLLGMAQVLTETPEMTRVIWREMLSGGKTAVRAYSRSETGALPLLLREIERLQKEGWLRADLDVRHAAVGLIAPMSWSLIYWPVLRVSLGYDEFGDSYLRGIVLHLIRALFDGCGAPG